MIQQMRERRAQGMVVFWADHHIAVGFGDPRCQIIERGRRLAPGMGEMRLERTGQIEIQRVDQVYPMAFGLEPTGANPRDAQPEPRRAWRRAVPHRAEKNEKPHPIHVARRRTGLNPA